MGEAQKSPAKERASASGLAHKLAEFLAENRRARARGDYPSGPTSAAQLADLISTMGRERRDTVNERTVRLWINGITLPESRYVAYLERILGCAWSYLDDPETVWPREANDEALMDLVRIFPAAALERLTAALRDASPRSPRGAKPR